MSDLDPGQYLLSTLAGLIILAAFAWLVDVAMKRDGRRQRRGEEPGSLARLLAVWDIRPGERDARH